MNEVEEDKEGVLTLDQFLTLRRGACRFLDAIGLREGVAGVLSDGVEGDALLLSEGVAIVANIRARGVDE